MCVWKCCSGRISVAHLHCFVLLTQKATVWLYLFIDIMALSYVWRRIKHSTVARAVWLAVDEQIKLGLFIFGNIYIVWSSLWWHRALLYRFSARKKMFVPKCYRYECECVRIDYSIRTNIECWILTLKSYSKLNGLFTHLWESVNGRFEPAPL